MIYLGADHGGYQLKEKIKDWLKNWNLAYLDLGNTIYEETDDYPVFAQKVAKQVSLDEEINKYPTPWKDRSKGILICRSSAGMVITANKIKGIKAVSAFDEESAKHTRLHNDSNIIALGADYIDEEKIKKILAIWLNTEFSSDLRHWRRVKMIEEMEK